MKKIITICLSALMLVLFCMSTFAENSKRVYDLAKVLTEDEEKALEERIASAQEETGMDIVFVTTDSKNGKRIREYADEFYENGNFGTGDEKSGVLFLLDMEDRTCYISTSGDMIDYLSDRRIDSIVGDEYGNGGDEKMWNVLVNGDYSEALTRGLNDIVSYYREGLPSDAGRYTESGQLVSGNPAPKEKKISPVEMIISVVIAAIVGFIGVSGIKREYSMKNEKKAASGFKYSYRSASAFAFAVMNDNLVDRSVARRLIPVVTSSGSGSHGGSTIHTSGGGMMHGGGGGGRHF